MTAPLAVVGALNVDVVLQVASLPAPGDTVVAVRRSTSGLGGKGANQAAAAAAFWGVRDAVAMVGCVGDDLPGQDILDDLRRRGVDVHGTRVAPGRSGAATVAVDPDGQNLVLVDPGANASLLPADVSIPAVARAEVLLLQLEIPHEAALAAIGHTAGRVVLNPAPSSGADRLVAGVDVLVPNVSELSQLVGAKPALGFAEALDQVRRLSARCDVVVTMGRAGALVHTRDGRVNQVQGVDVVARDTTGAGDCFCGVLASVLVEGRDLVEATQLAVAASALSVTAMGARGRLPSRHEVERRRSTGGLAEPGR